MVCTLKEFNEYRQYLTTLKLEAEKMVLREEVGKAEPWWTPVSDTVARAGALLAACRGGEAVDAEEVRAVPLGRVLWQGKEYWAANSGSTGCRGGHGQEGDVQARRVAREAFLFCPRHVAEAERCPGPAGRLSTQGRERLSRQQQAPTWCHLSAKASARAGQSRGCLQTAGRE